MTLQPRLRALAAPFTALALALALLVALPARDALAQSEPQPGQDVRVSLVTGETLYGVLVERDEDRVVLRIAGIETAVPAGRIESMVRQRTPQERYRSMRAIIDDDDVPRLLLLVRWLMEREMLDEARLELDAALDEEPTNPDAQRLSRLLDQRLALRERSERARPAASEPRADRPEPESRVTPPGRFVPGQFPLLSEEQINLLKVYELDLDDPPRLLVDRETASAFLTRYAGAAGLPRTENERNEFLRKPPVEILEAMFALRARELYPQVRVLELPVALDLFRENVSAAWITRNCGSVNCHGGTDAPPPHIYNRRPFSEASAMTNFVILDRHRLPDGRPLIDYERPAESPLLQLGLPQPDSAYPHPDVPGWRPAFRSRDSRRFKQAVDWINAMIRPRPDVPIDYEPPDINAIRAANRLSEGESENADGPAEPPPDGEQTDQRR